MDTSPVRCAIAITRRLPAFHDAAKAGGYTVESAAIPRWLPASHAAGYPRLPRSRCWALLGALIALSAVPPASSGQSRQEAAPAAPAATPILTNICPKFVLQGVPRRIKFYGAHMTDAQIEYEGDDLSFRDYKVDPDNLAFSVIIEATRTAPVGKRVLTIVGQQETGREAIVYVLKREDRALLQRDLARCPWMKGDTESPDSKGSGRRPPQ